MSGTKIVVLATGGTIAGTAASTHDTLGYTAARLGVDELLASVPQVRDFDIVTEQVAQIDSKDMSFEVWQRLALRCTHWLADDSVQGVVITHGTDTLEETAYFLHSVLASDKPVVLTCAMRPATALLADGPQNLVDAITVSSTPGARGVVAVCAGKIHGAVDVAKRHTYRLDAFHSGDPGPIGYIENGAVRLVREWPEDMDSAGTALRKVARAARWPRVEVVLNYAGATGATVEALVAQRVEGLVVAGTGNGSLHRDLEAALEAAQAAGVQVLRSTRCAQGRVQALPDDVLPDSGGLSPVKARVALLLQLLP